MKAQTYQLPESTIKKLRKYVKGLKKKGKKITRQGVVNEAILEKVGNI